MLRLNAIVAAYGKTRVLDGISLDIADETLAILGPSGSGKSTLLRVVAGLHLPREGTVTWQGQDITRVPAHKRGFGLMFQDYALFPHLDVSNNVAFGLRMQGLGRAEIFHRVENALERVDLTGYGTRRVGELSGGQMQRVALARALAPEPSMLLLDEPLGSLDRELRTRLVDELSTAIARAGVPAIYVTHDHEEAFTIGDRVAVLDHGKVDRIGTPRDLWKHPQSVLVARMLGLHSIIAGVSDGAAVETPVGTFEIAAPKGPATLAIQPEAVSIDPEGVIVGEVVAVRYRGSDHVVDIAVGDQRLTTIISSVPSAQVRLSVDPEGVSLIA